MGSTCVPPPLLAPITGAVLCPLLGHLGLLTVVQPGRGVTERETPVSLCDLGKHAHTFLHTYIHACLQTTRADQEKKKKKRDDGAWMPRCSARRLRRRSLEAALARRSASHNQRASDRRTDGLTNWPTAPAACSPTHIGPHRCWARKAQAADRQKRKEGPRECAPIDPGTWADKNKRHTHLLAPGGRALNAVRWCCSRDHWGSAVRGKRGVSYHRDS